MDKKKTKIVKEKDIIKNSDLEDESKDRKRILVVALILALLIGAFAYIRSTEGTKKNEDNQIEEPSDNDNDDDDNSDDSVIDNNTDNSSEIYYPSNPVSNEKNDSSSETVNIWGTLENVLPKIEAGSNFSLPKVTVDDNGEQIDAVITYQFRENSNSNLQNVDSFDATKVGEYLITYTISYKDGHIDSKEICVIVEDTTAPIIKNISNDNYYNEDILLDIIEYSPYKVMLNGEEYDPTLPITNDGIYTLVVTEEKENAMSVMVIFTIDKTLPEIIGVDHDGYYNQPVVIDVNDENISSILVAKDNIEIPFENGITEIGEEGSYQVIATDKAGNRKELNFTIDNTIPEIEVIYTPDNQTLTDELVTVTVISNESLQEVEGWVLSSDKLSLTKEFDENISFVLEIKDLAGNTIESEIVIDYIDYQISYNPTLTLENLVANKVKATITSLQQLIIDDPLNEWVEIIEEDVYKYEKIYDKSGIEIVHYEDVEGNQGSIEINISIELDDLFVSYIQDDLTMDVTAYVLTNEEVLSLPEGWTLDTTYEGEGFRYFKVYTENVDYETVEFNTENNLYVATIIIDNIIREENPTVDEEAPTVITDVTYIREEGSKTLTIITITADEEIQEVEDWSLSESGTSLIKIIERPLEVPTEEQIESVIVTDMAGNETVVEYTYHWN